MTRERWFKTACVTFVLAISGITLFKFANADFSGRPDRRTLVAELIEIRSAAEGGPTQYFEKSSIRGAYAQLHLAGGQIDPVISAVAHTATGLGWEATSTTNSEFEAKYCKGRLSLVLDAVGSSANMRVEYGVYWTADTASSLYCAASRKGIGSLE